MYAYMSPKFELLFMVLHIHLSYGSLGFLQVFYLADCAKETSHIEILMFVETFMFHITLIVFANSYISFRKDKIKKIVLSDLQVV